MDSRLSWGAVILALGTSAVGAEGQVSGPQRDQPPGGPADRTLPIQIALDVPVANQQTPLWCWAASAEMIMRYLGKEVAQCEQATQAGSAQSCCASPTPGECIHAGWPDFRRFGFQAKRTYGTGLTWDQLRHELGELHIPFAFSWHWPGGGGHMMVAVGYIDLSDSRLLLINDPWEPAGKGSSYFVTYAEYLEAPGNHTHWDDFYGISATLP